MTTNKEEYVENILTDVGYFYDQGNDHRVLVFPPLCSFNRLVIHKTTEVNFSELVTFSIGRGGLRRTVVAFRTTLDRAGTDLQQMNEQNSHYARGRGRGRGKDLTPNERVAQWVNQREVRRLNKERWSNKGQASDGNAESSIETLHEPQGTDEGNEKEKSRSKRTPQPQLYIPPSLRQKKAQIISMNDNSDLNSTSSNQTHLKDCSGKVSHGTESKLLASNESSHPQAVSKGRGRGRKRPEVEVYVPRALRAAQRQIKEAAPDSLESGNLKSETTEQKTVNGSSGSQVRNEFETCPNLPSTDKVCPTPKRESTYVLKDLKIRDTDRNFCPVISSLAPGEDEKVQTSTPEYSEPAEEDTGVIQTPSNSGDINYTFEFYDPAVIAFMPSSPVSQGAEENLNNSNTSQLYQSNSTKPTDSSCNSISEQDRSLKEEDTLSLADSDESEIAKAKSVTPPAVEIPTSSQSTPLSSTLFNESATKLYETLNESESLHLSESVGTEAYQSAPPEPKLASSQDSQSMEVDLEKKKTDAVAVAEEDPEDSWDTMFDDNGDCLDESLMDELIQTVGKVEVTTPKINYLKYEPKEPDMDMKGLGHVVEIYDFSPELATCDLISAFRDFASRGFDVKWVDDTHALGVFSNTVAANEALQMIHPLLKIRPMTQASRQSQSKARHCQEFLQPYKARPETTSIAARRLVAGALGMAPQVSREMRDRERQKLKEFKEKRRQEKQQKKDIWDGSFGKCAMDDV